MNTILEHLKSNMFEDCNLKRAPPLGSENTWSWADLFIRQWLNNGGDGFGMINVYDVYEYLCHIKEDLIKYKMISKVGFNNSGYPLWKDYNFEWATIPAPCEDLKPEHKLCIGCDEDCGDWCCDYCGLAVCNECAINEEGIVHCGSSLCDKEKELLTILTLN